MVAGRRAPRPAVVPSPRRLAATAAAAALAGVASASCPHDNLLRCFLRTPTLAITYCSWTVGIYPTASTVYLTTFVGDPLPWQTTTGLPTPPAVTTTTITTTDSSQPPSTTARAGTSASPLP